MTTPNNAAPSPAPQFGVTGTDGSIAGLPARTQDAVTTYLQNQVKASAAWNNSTANVWAGLRRGTVGNPVALVTAAFESFAQSLLGGVRTEWESLEHIGTDVQNFGNTVLNGFIDLFRLPPVPVGRITVADTSGIASDSGFSVLPSGTAGTTWYYDATDGHTSPGSAWIAADGAQHELLDVAAQVAPGQTYSPSVWVSWNGATGTAASFELIVAEFQNEWRTGTTVVSSATPTGTSTWQQVAGTYTVPVGVDQVSIGVRVDAGFTAGTLGVDDLAAPSTGLLPLAAVQNLTQRWDSTASILGINSTDLNTLPDFATVWNNLLSSVPPIVNTAIDDTGASIGTFLTSMVSAFDAVGRALGTPTTTGQNVAAVQAAAVKIADRAQAAYMTTITNANAAGDAQAGADAGVDVVDLLTFTGTEGAALTSDWVSSQTSGVNDLVVRVESGVPMMGIRATGTPDLRELPASQYYSATWAATFSTTRGFGQLVEMVLGPDGNYADTVILFHSDSAFSSGAYLKANAGGLSFGSYTNSGSTYAFTQLPGAIWSGTLSPGRRVGCWNDASSNVYNLTVDGTTVVQVTDTAHTIPRDATHVSARILMQRKLVTWNAGWPWQTSAYMDGFAAAQVIFADYDPPTIPGSGARYMRLSTTAVSQASSTSGSLFTANLFDDTEEQSSDITLTNGGTGSACNRITVTQTGRYHVNMRVATGGDWGATGAAGNLSIWKNGSVYALGDGTEGGGLNGGAHNYMISDWVLPLVAGDYIEPGYVSNTTFNVGDSSSGAGTYIAIAKLS